MSFSPYSGGAISENFILDISKGKIAGHDIKYVHSYATSIGVTQEFIWPLGGTLTFNDTPSNLYLTSSSAADNQNVSITWLDDSYVSHSGVYQINGRTPVLIGFGLRVNNAFTVAATPTSGNVYVSNALTHTNGVPTQITTVMMYEAKTQTRSMASYTVPAGHTVFGLSGYFSSPKGRDNDFFWNIRNPTAPTPTINTNVLSVYESTVEVDFKYSPIPEKTDAFFTSSTSNSSGRVSIRIPIIIVDNNYL